MPAVANPIGSATRLLSPTGAWANGLGVMHVLHALLSRERPDPAAELFQALGVVDRTEVRNRLQEV